MIYTFEKKEWGTVFLTQTPTSGLPKTHALTPGRDLVVSTDGTKIEIDFWENSDRKISMLPEEIIFSASSPVGNDTTDIYEALEQLSRDFFFDVSAASEIIPQPAIPDDDGSDTQDIVNNILAALRANNIILT